MDIKRVTLLLFACCSFLLAAGQQNHSATELPDMDIFLAFGQSNMAGRAPIEPSVAGTLDNVQLLAVGNNWVDASNPMNIYSTIRGAASMQRVGPSYSFAKAMASHTGRTIGMVVNARGGTAIQEFIPGGLYYNDNIARIQQAKPFGTIKGIIWHQGESNNGDDLYLYRLDTLVTKYRETIGEKVFFVAGELGGWNSDGGSTPKYRRFNERIPGMLTVVDHADYVLNTSLTHIGDHTHFNLPSQILLGQRYAKKMLAVVYEIDISIIDIKLSGNGFITMVGEEDKITSTNDFSYTFETSSLVDMTIEAGEGKLFTGLVIDGTQITEAAGSGSYIHSFTATKDQAITISMETKTEGSVGIREQNHVFSVYPIPATNSLHIDKPVDFNIESVKIYNAQGRMVYMDHSGLQIIDISSYSKGVYILSINDTKNIRFIKN